ncbi:MAG: hypothetical protein Fur005_27850 [Roseiflexaceae bacterium]
MQHDGKKVRCVQHDGRKVFLIPDPQERRSEKCIGMRRNAPLPARERGWDEGQKASPCAPCSMTEEAMIVMIYIWEIIASANCEVRTSVAPLINRAKS